MHARLCTILALLTPPLVAGLAQSQDAPRPERQPESQSDEQIEALGEQKRWSIKDMTTRDLTLYWDNDGTVPNIIDDTDRYYTNGTGLELSFDPNLTDHLREKLAPAGKWDNPRFGAGLALKQRIYTSEFITQTNPPADDHPYAGYLYLALSFQRADQHKHDHFGLDLGVVGDASGAEDVQKFIHRNFPGEDEPRGWGTQLGNEVTFNFNYERTWRSERGSAGGVEFDMLPALGFDLGTVSVKARARMTLRAGMNLPDDFGPPSFLGHKDHTVYASDWGEGDFSFYVYASASVDAVARDLFLDGDTFSSSRSTDSEPFVALASVGVVARYKSAYLGWTQSFQSDEFDAQADGQTYGSIVLGLSLNY